MTRGEIKALAAYWLDDVSYGYFTEAQLNVFINQAQREVQKILLNAGQDYYTKCAVSATVINQARYSLPDDFLKIMRLSFITSGSGANAKYQRIHPITRNEQDVAIYDTTGDPLYYFFYKNTFRLAPIPDRSVTLELQYAYRVTDMSDDANTPDVPEDYHELLAIFAARDGFLKDGRDMAPIERKLKYYEELMRENAQQRAQDSPRYIVSTGGGFGSV